MEFNKGILLIALGHANYGKQAAALAASIRVMDSQIPIVVFTDGTSLNHLREGERKLFTDIRILPGEYYQEGSRNNYFRPKIHLYDITPFEHTLFMDVDTCWMKRPPSLLFKELEKVKFTGVNEGYWDVKTGSFNCNTNYTFWAEPADILEAYKDNKKFMGGKMHQIRTEFLYFKKCEANEKYFSLVKELYVKPGVKMELIGQRIPDEFAFNMASCLLAHYPHKSGYDPIYWDYTHAKRKLTRNEKLNNFYAYSIGGNVTSRPQREIYNAVVKQAYRNLGLLYPFQLSDITDKKRALPERMKI